MATSMSLMRVFCASTSRVSRSVLQRHNINNRCAFQSFYSTTPTADKAESKDSPPEAANTETASASDAEHKKAIEELQKQITKLEGDAKEHKDKYMRALAETENVRNRMKKQVDDAKLFGIQGFCKDLLEVSDILRTAVGTVPKEELTDANPHLVNLFEGLNMTEGQLVKVFKKHGLEDISPKEGDQFDPNVHEALFQVPIQVKETQAADTIANVQKIGFRLHSRTLRPALVGVFK